MQRPINELFESSISNVSSLMDTSKVVGNPIKIDENTFIDYNELIESPLPQSLAKKFVTKYKTIPEKDGEIYVGNLTRYYNIKRKNTEDKIEIDMIQYSQKPKSL